MLVPLLQGKGGPSLPPRPLGQASKGLLLNERLAFPTEHRRGWDVEPAPSHPQHPSKVRSMGCQADHHLLECVIKLCQH